MEYSFGTAIAAIWTPKRVVLAAAGRRGAAPVDDLKTAGKIIFAVAGLVGCSETDFDALKLIKAALEAEGSFSDKVQNAGKEIEADLNRAVQHVHDKSPGDFKKYLSGRDALTVVFSSPQHDGVALSQLSFKTKKRGKEIVFQTVQADYPNPKTSLMSVEIVTAGVAAAVSGTFLAGVKTQEALVYPEQALQKFLALAVAADPEHIGYPATVVTQNAAGAVHTVFEAP